MRALTLVLTTVVALAGACGDDDDGGSQGSGSSTAGSTSETGSTGMPTGSSGSTTDTTTDATTGTGSSTATGSSSSGTATTMATSTGPTTTVTGTEAGTETTTGGTAALDVVMSELALFQGCMPVIPPDPLGATFTLALTNDGDEPATATVTSVAIINAAAIEVGTFEVTPATFGPIAVGETLTEVVTKTAESLMPPNACGVAECNQTYTIEITLDVDGAPVAASSMAPVSCVF